ncbi:MAG TPA: F0F1 ATP synthase subunit B [Ignavibacteria bacterium]|nr:F0F1 ATP synthase subunit B [Ignavibacteria bacterium]HRJ98960.1 F0F1 ATP synthase subunit B [Ignavibacteria bacterium]
MIYYLSLLYNYSFIFLFSGDEKPMLLSINPGLIIWQLIIFVLLLLILKKIAWKPLLSALNSREQSIKDSIEQAENLKKEAENMIAENKKIMADANAQSMKVINEAKEMSNKIGEEIKAKAAEDSRKLIEHAKEEIKKEKESAMADLRNEVSDLAIKAAEKILNDNLDEAKQKKIVNDFISQIPKN